MKTKSIPIVLTVNYVQEKLRLQDTKIADALIARAAPLMDPKVGYNLCYVNEKTNDSVVIDGTSFRSRVLAKKLSDVGRVFAFVITLGAALEEEIDGCTDLLEKYYLDEIGNMTLRKARLKFEKHLRKQFALDKIGFLSPGSLPDWPIEQQKELFCLLGDAQRELGLHLTDSMLMLPRKSVSGIYFPSKVSFFSCQLCPRDRCEGRKALYNEALAREYGVHEE